MKKQTMGILKVCLSTMVFLEALTCMLYGIDAEMKDKLTYKKV